jgi:hypothetical protein
MLTCGLRKKGKEIKVVWESEIVNSDVRSGSRGIDSIVMDMIGNRGYYCSM